MKILKAIWQVILDIGSAGGEKYYVDFVPPIIDRRYDE